MSKRMSWVSWCGVLALSGVLAFPARLSAQASKGPAVAIDETKNTVSADGREEYVHILTPPVGNARSIVLPKPLESFTSAYNLRTQNPVAMKTLPDGSLELTLDDKDQWHELDTVIGLEIVK